MVPLLRLIPLRVLFRFRLYNHQHISALRLEALYHINMNARLQTVKRPSTDPVCASER